MPSSAKQLTAEQMRSGLEHNSNFSAQQMANLHLNNNLGEIAPMKLNFANEADDNVLPMPDNDHFAGGQDSSD